MVNTSVNFESISTVTDREWCANFVEGVLEWGEKENNYDCDASTMPYSEVRQVRGAMGLSVRDNGFYRHSVSGSNSSRFVPCVGRGETSGDPYPSVHVLGLCRVEGCLVALVEMEDKNDRSNIMSKKQQQVLLWIGSTMLCTMHPLGL
eukprot:108369_1